MKTLGLKKSHLPGLGLVIAALIVYFWAAQRGWDSEPTDAHSTRQAQTAITAQMLHEQGLSPLTPFNGLGPPWNVPMEFPTYQIITAVAAHATGGDIISAGRLVGILGTLVLLPALWLILRHTGLGFSMRSFAIGLLLTAPLWMLFSRSILIESWAAALAMWWLAGLLETLSAARLDRRWLAATTLLGVIAAVTKVTSFAVLLPAGAIFTLIVARRSGTNRLIWAAIATLPGIVAAVAWNHYADLVKYAHPFANFLTSDNLSQWNWGTLEQRLDPAWWSRIFAHLELIFPRWWVAIAAVGAVWANSRQRLGMALCTAAILTGPIAFANLYYVHNYYMMAITPAAVALVAISAGAIWQRWATGAASRWILGVVAIGLLGLQFQSYREGLGRGQIRDRPLPALGLLINELTTPDDRIIIIGQEWDPLLTYTINRPLTFVRENYETDEDAWKLSRAAMAPDDYTVLIAMESVAGDTRFVHHRCRELGLLTDPIASTPKADIYVTAAARDALRSNLETLRTTGQILPARPDRMGPGESRVEFLTAEWKPLIFAEAKGLFDAVQPLPDRVFSQYNPAVLPAFDRDVLHIHPPGGLRFAPLSRDRTVTMDYGLRPEIWLNQHESDGVRFRFLVRGPGDRQREIWSEFVQPLSRPEHQALLQIELPLPAEHELELWIDAGPDHNPGYDWSIIANLRIE